MSTTPPAIPEVRGASDRAGGPGGAPRLDVRDFDLHVDASKGWLALAGVLALFVFGGLSHAGRRKLDGELANGTFRVTARGAVRAVRAYLTNEDDMSRCFAYAQAILGRPYRSYFVRARADWEPTFVRGAQEDPDATATVYPQGPLRPYRDFLVEYPPGFFLVLLPPALVAATADGYALAFKAEMATFLLVSLWAVLRLARAAGVDGEQRARLPGMFAAAVLALGVVCTHRYDAFVAACTAWAVASAGDGRPRAAGVWLGIAVAAKGVPVLLLAPLVAYAGAGVGGTVGAGAGAGAGSTARGGHAAAGRLLAGAAITTAGLVAAALWWCGRGLLDAFAYHAARPLQIESTWAAVLSLATSVRPGLVTVVHSYSSRNLRGGPVEAVGAIAGVVTAAAIVILTVVLVRRLLTSQPGPRRLGVVVDGAVALFAAYMGLGKVFCPQYLVWLLPFALVSVALPGRSARRTRAGLAILIATQIIYPLGYPAVKELAPWACALVLARDLALLAWAAALLLRNPATTGVMTGGGWRGSGGAEAKDGTVRSSRSDVREDAAAGAPALEGRRRWRCSETARPHQAAEAADQRPARGAVPSSPNLVTLTPTVARSAMNRSAILPAWNWMARPGLSIPPPLPAMTMGRLVWVWALPSPSSLEKNTTELSSSVPPGSGMAFILVSR